MFHVIVYVFYRRHIHWQLAGYSVLAFARDHILCVLLCPDLNGFFKANRAQATSCIMQFHDRRKRCTPANGAIAQVGTSKFRTAYRAYFC